MHPASGREFLNIIRDVLRVVFWKNKYPHDPRHEKTQGSSPEGRESAVQLGLAESHGSRRPLIPLL